MMKKISLMAISALALSACNDQASTGGAAGGSRQEIRIVGSSTVFPFAKAASEAFAKADASRKSPVLESNGTGGGIEQFCKGVGAESPDIANASRRMKKSEFENCQKNGVKDIIEVQVGIDGLALAESNQGAKFALTTADVYKALAANPFGKPQTAKLWSDVNPALPKLPISAYGPPTTSGTRDSFHELIMEAGCKTDAAMKALKETNEDKYKVICTEVRSDGADGIACWFIDTDYNEESFFVRHAYFLGANDPYKSLKTTLKAEINQEAWDSLNSDTSRAFDKPKSGRIAVKVINHLGDEVMKVFRA